MVNVEPGTYSLTLVDGSGKAIQEISFEVYSKGPFTEVLNLENIFTGNYTLLVKSNEKFIGAFKLVVIK